MKTIRYRDLNHKDVRRDGEFVLYWMVAARRASWNFALDRALDLAKEVGQPVLVLEALRADYPWANARLHRFAVEGMASNRESFGRAGLTYYPYVEPVAPVRSTSLLLSFMLYKICPGHEYRNRFGERCPEIRSSHAASANVIHEINGVRY